MPDESAEKQFQRLRPDRVGTLAEVQEFLDRFVWDVVRQPTHESSQLRLESLKDEFQVTGWVHYPAVLGAFQNLWAQTPFASYPHTIAALPTPGSGGGNRLFSASGGLLIGRSGPGAEDPVVHVWEHGSPVRPLHRHKEAILCQSETGYLGWVREETYRAGAASKGEPIRSFTEIDSERLEEIVTPWLGTPYVWGGSGRSGIDCSGFVQIVFKEFGILLPRDANQQMLGGRLVATHDRRESLAPGDLLFFTQEDGRIGHVGVSLGEGRVIHAERPRVSMFSLEEDADDFNSGRFRHFAFAKRYFS